jgi:hypothetical protein
MRVFEAPGLQLRNIAFKYNVYPVFLVFLFKHCKVKCDLSSNKVLKGIVSRDWGGLLMVLVD